MRGSDVTRAIGAYGQPGGGAHIIRVGSVEISAMTYENRRLAWTGSSYLPTTEVIVFYEPTNIVAPKQLGDGEETWVIWREAANRWEEISGGSSGDVIYAQVNEGSGVGSGDATFAFDNAIGIVGEAPSGGGTAQNQYGQTYSDNEWVILHQRKDNDEWITERGGTAGTLVRYFRLTEDMGYSDAFKLAKPTLTLDDWDVDSGASEVFLLNPQTDGTGQFYGLAPYTDENTGAASHPGYLASAVKVTDDFDDGGGPTGKEAWRIITMEGPATQLIVSLQGSYSLGGTHCLLIANDGGPWGESFGARLPRIEDNAYDLTVDDDLDMASAAQVGDVWFVHWDRDDEKYVFWRPKEASVAPLEIAWVNAEVNAMTFDYSAFEADPGITANAVTIMEWSGTTLVKKLDGGDPIVYAGVNFSKTAIEASTSQPLLYSGYYESGVGFILISPFDIRSQQNFTASATQVLYHNGDGVGRLDSEECP